MRVLSAAAHFQYHSHTQQQQKKKQQWLNGGKSIRV
jgi:hypothetical protein